MNQQNITHVINTKIKLFRMVTSFPEAYLAYGSFESRILFAHYFDKLLAYLILFKKLLLF